MLSGLLTFLRLLAKLQEVFAGHEHSTLQKTMNRLPWLKKGISLLFVELGLYMYMVDWPENLGSCNITTTAIIQKRPISPFSNPLFVFFLELVKIRSPLSSILRSTRTRKDKKEIEKVDTMETNRQERRDYIW